MSNRFLTGVENDSKTPVSSKSILAWMAAGNLEKSRQIAKQIGKSFPSDAVEPLPRSTGCIGLF